MVDEEARERVETERVLLGDRINNLEDFIDDGDGYLYLSLAHQSLLNIQLSAMKTYRDVLSARLDLWIKEERV